MMVRFFIDGVWKIVGDRRCVVLVFFALWGRFAD